MTRALIEKWKKLVSGKQVPLNLSEVDQMKQAAKNVLASIEAMKKMGMNPKRRKRRRNGSKKYALASAKSIARRLNIYGGRKLCAKGSKIIRKNCGCKKRGR